MSSSGPRVAGVRDCWSRAPLRRDRGQRAGIGLLLRLALLGALIVGLVGMHQLPTGDACCSTPPTSSPGVPAGATSRHSDLQVTPTPALAPRLLPDATSHRGVGEHGLATDMLGMCLAMLVAAAGLLVISLRTLGEGPPDHHELSPAEVLFSAPPRGPPVPRRLAQLQVLRL